MSTKKTLEQLRQTYNPVKENNNNQQREQLPNNYYKFWDMKPGERCVIRFLADTNDSNPHGFLVEKKYHTLTINGEEKSIPCPKNYGEKECAICKLSSDYYKVNDKVNGKKYYRKLQHIGQVLVIEDPLPIDAATGENSAGKVRYITIGYQIYNIIKEAFANQDEPLEGVPYDNVEGYDFIIKKTQSGTEHPSYTVGTKFMNRQRALSDEELSVANEGSIDLSTLLPKNPGAEKVAAMLEAHLNGVSFNDSSSNAGNASNNDDDENDEIPFTPRQKPAPSTPASSDGGVDDDVEEMLAAIKARRAQQQ